MKRAGSPFVDVTVICHKLYINFVCFFLADRWGSLVLSKNDQHTKGPGSIVSFFLFIINTFKNSASVSKMAATVYEGYN